MKNVLLAALVIGLATTAVSGQAFAKTKAEREAAKAERSEKKAERAEKKADRQERKADRAEGKYGKWDKNHDDKMSFSEMKAKYDSRPSWSYRKDLAGMDIDYSKVSPTMTAILSAVGGSGGGQSGAGGEHNGAASDH